VKKGRHRRYEEARALKQNQDLDLDSIFDSLDVGEQNDNQTNDEDSPAFDAWADDYEDGATGEAVEETAETS
jgi:hypothetical protein